jgi:hypothetical protein
MNWSEKKTKRKEFGFNVINIDNEILPWYITSNNKNVNNCWIKSM